MSCVETLKISDDKKKYIIDVLNPILEELVTDLLKKCPDSPLEFIAEFAAHKLAVSSAVKASGNGDSAEVARLKEEIAFLKEKMNESSQVVAAMAGEGSGHKIAQSDSEESKESDDDDDNELAEMPEGFEKAGAGTTKSRASVSAEAYGQWNVKKEFTPVCIAKSEDQKKRIHQVLSASFMFSSVEGKDMDVVINAMGEVVAEPGHTLIQEGDDGDFLFVIEEGVLDCVKMIDGAPVVVKTCEAGDVFGELALLYNCPRAASVVAKEKCLLWKLDRDTFNNIVKDAAARKRDLYQTFLQKTPLLAPVDAYQISQIADALKVEIFDAGIDIVKENEPGDKFYIVEEGTLKATKNGEEVMAYSAGDYFGELALMRNQPRNATVTATSKSRILALDRKSFNRLLGPLEALLTKNMGRYNLDKTD